MKKHKLITMTFTAGLIAFLASCVEMPKKPEPELNADEVKAAEIRKAEEKAKLSAFNYAGLRGTNKNVTMTIVQSILPGDANYFPVNPSWAEHVIEVGGLSESLTLRRVRLIGATGVFVEPAKRAREMASAPKIQGEVVQTVAVTVGAIGVGTAAIVGGAGVAGMFVAPVALGAYMYYKAGEMDAEVEYQKEFERRTPRIGTTIDKNSVVRGSVFFPLLESPRAFVLEYSTTDGSARELRIDITRATKTTSNIATDVENERLIEPSANSKTPKKKSSQSPKVEKKKLTKKLPQ
jgi:hypothetical protein